MSRTIVALVAACMAFLVSSTARAQSATACEKRNNDSFAKMLACVDVGEMRTHQIALQAIADTNGGDRVASSAGNEAAVAYVAGEMAAAGYQVTLDSFPFIYTESLGEQIFERLAPGATTYVDGEDFLVAQWSGSGAVTGEVEAIDLNLVDPLATSSGCEPEDFAGFTPGNVALLQRGLCPFEVKVTHAEAAGAAAVILFNQGASEESMGLLLAFLDDQATIPVVFTTFAHGQALAAGASVHLDISWLTEVRTSTNVFAESPGGDPSNVVMVGAHLDSVHGSPGINDNASSISALLEIAQMLSNTDHPNKVRFAFWGGEEFGLAGSADWVFRQFVSGEIADVALYLNFDMIASPNFVRFVVADEGVPGAGAINEFFHLYFAEMGLPVEEIFVGNRSDSYYFTIAGRPHGGAFTGADQIKSEAQAALFGGTAGAPLDPCYHAACDDLDNVHLGVLREMAGAAAVATLQFAMNTEAVNGVAGHPAFAPARSASSLAHAIRTTKFAKGR